MLAKRARRRIESRWPAGGAIARSVIALLAVGLFPLGYTICTSLHDYQLTNPARGTPFVGLETYAEVLTNPSFLDAIGRTLAFLVIVLPIELGLGLTRPDAQTAPVAATSYISGYKLPWGEIMAAGSLIAIPVVALALVVSRPMVRGLALGAVS